MHIHLPRREQYYRPSRARELRRRAARLEWWAGRGALVVTAAVALVLGLLSMAVLPILPWAIVGDALVVAVLVSCAPMLCIYHECAESLRERVYRLRKEAAALE